MEIAVRYFTKTGNTKKLADAIASAVGVTAQEVSVPLEGKVDVVFLGSSVYAAGVDGAVREFVEKNAKNIGCIIGFSTAAILRSTYNQVKKIAEANDVDMATEEFHCRGSFSVMHRNRPNADDLQKAVSFAKNVINNFKVK